jgi:CHAT domain-containing protein/tetratricopeptide (TPR) repeat protein
MYWPRYLITTLFFILLACATGTAAAQRPLTHETRAHLFATAGGGAVRGATSAVGDEILKSLDEGQLDEALRKVGEHIEVAKARNDGAGVAALIDFIGLLHNRRGLPRLAVESHKQALRELRNLKGPGALIARLSAQNNLGVAHYYAGQYEDALRILEALVKDAAVRQDLVEHRVALARARNNLGLVQDELGRDKDALGSFSEAADAVTVRADDEEDEDRSLHAQILNNIGRVLGRSAAMLPAARASLEKARRLAQKAGFPLLEADVLDSIAEVLLAGAETAKGGHRHALAEEARQATDDALRLVANSIAPAIRASILTQRARALAALGVESVDVDRAFEDAVSAANSVGVVARQRDARAARGGHYRATHRADAAIADYELALHHADMVLGRSISENQRAALTSIQRIYAGLVEAYLDKKDIAKAQRYALESSSAALRARVRAGGLASDAEAQTRVDARHGALALEEELTERLARETNPDNRQRLQKRIDGVRRHGARALNELRARWGSDYRNFFGVNPVDLEKLVRALPDGRVVISYLMAPDRLHIFVASKRDGLVWVPVGNATAADLRHRIKGYRDQVAPEGMQRPAPAPIIDWDAPDVRQLRDLTTALYDDLLGSIEYYWREATHLVIAPSGLLYYLPFHALGPYDMTEKTVKYLALEKRVSYFNPENTTDIITGPTKPRLRTMLAFGGPTYKHERPRLAQLKHAPVEVNEIANIPGAKVVVLAGSQATLANLRAELTPVAAVLREEGQNSSDGARFGIVHLATHGVLDRRVSADAWLAMEGTEQLKARDVRATLRGLSSAHLVTLSACQTAIDSVDPGAEVATLAYHFFQADVPSVVATLWEVDDASTSSLMVQFYRSLFAQPAHLTDKAAALQSAQRALANTPATRHPYYWAPFILIGDWR